MSDTRTDPFETLVAGLQASFESKPQRNLLFLSGGGSYGAWGAGVLNGWSRTGNRPAFDVVTGVSTGAVQATAAFLGEEMDPLLRVAYTTLTTRDVYGKSWFSLLDNLDPLREQLRTRYLTDETLQKVARVASDERRRLCVGVVDLDSAAFLSCDLTQMALDGDYERYRETVLASTANPAFLQPVKIDGRRCVDGGVRHQVYAESTLGAAARAHAATRARGDESLCAWVLVNGKTSFQEKQVSSWSLPIMMRGLEIALQGALLGSLYVASYRVGAPGSGAELAFSWIPEATPLDFPADEFIPDKMKPLFEEGVRWGEKNQWGTSLPTPVDVRVLPGPPRG